MKLIQNWRKGWKFYSVWAYALILALPELYSQLMYSGVIDMYDPPPYVNVLRVIAFVGLVLRFVDQSKPGADPGPCEDTYPQNHNGEAP